MISTKQNLPASELFLRVSDFESEWRTCVEMQHISDLTVEESCHTCRQVRAGWHPVWTEKTMTPSSQWANCGQQGCRLSGVTSDEHLLQRVSVASLVSQTKDEPSIWLIKLHIGSCLLQFGNIILFIRTGEAWLGYQTPNLETPASQFPGQNALLCRIPFLLILYQNGNLQRNITLEFILSKQQRFGSMSNWIEQRHPGAVALGVGTERNGKQVWGKPPISPMKCVHKPIVQLILKSSLLILAIRVDPLSLWAKKMCGFYISLMGERLPHSNSMPCPRLAMNHTKSHARSSPQVQGAVETVWKKLMLTWQYAVVYYINLFRLP